MYVMFADGNTMRRRDIQKVVLHLGTKWEDIPEDFECPLCSVGKDQFSKAE